MTIDRDGRGKFSPVRLSIRDWLGIITVGLTMLGAAAGVYQRLIVVETKVDMLSTMIQQRADK